MDGAEPLLSHCGPVSLPGHQRGVGRQPSCAGNNLWESIRSVWKCLPMMEKKFMPGRVTVFPSTNHRRCSVSVMWKSTFMQSEICFCIRYLNAWGQIWIAFCLKMKPTSISLSLFKMSNETESMVAPNWEAVWFCKKHCYCTGLVNKVLADGLYVPVSIFFNVEKGILQHMVNFMSLNDIILPYTKTIPAADVHVRTISMTWFIQLQNDGHW